MKSTSNALVLSLRRFLPAFAGRASGNALIETALILAFFCGPLLVGTGEMGALVFDSIQVQDAARAGALYAMQSATFAADTSGIQAAAQQDAPVFGANLAVTPTTYYVCSASITGTQYTGAGALSNATAACTGTNNHPLQFIQVTASATVTPRLHCPGFGSSFNVSSVSAMEIEQ